MSGFLGEFFGTMVLILLGVGCGAGVNLKDNYARGQNWMFITLAWGMAVTFGVYIAGQMGSQGHLNPAVTLGFASAGLFSFSEVLSYLLVQGLGAFAGAALVILYYYPQFQATPNKDGNSVGIFATGPALKRPFFNVLNECIATFFFILILLNLGNFTTGLKPLIVGLLIMVVGQSLGGTTGFALNPARDLMPRLAYSILPVPHKANANWGYAWVPIVGPLCGGILASFVHIWING